LWRASFGLGHNLTMPASNTPTSEHARMQLQHKKQQQQQ